jgi:hypothetical protein
MRSKFLRDLLETKEDSPANSKLTPSAASTGKRVVRGAGKFTSQDILRPDYI